MNYYYDPTPLLGIALLLVIVIIIAVIVIPSRPKRYRRELVDLYVAAKVRTIAAKENLNLTEEYESFKRWLKKQRLEEKDLDSAMEEELKEKLIKDKTEDKKKWNR